MQIYENLYEITSEVSVFEVGRDCQFPVLPCGLGAGKGTRLLVSGESVRSRCRRRDETAGFRGFRVVSVPGVGRDCWFSGILCGLGAGRGTRPPGVGESERSKGREWIGGGAEGAQKAETPGQGPGVSE